MPGAVIGDGDRERGVHAAPSKKTNVLFLEKIAPPINIINARGYTQICVQRGRAGYDSSAKMVIIIWYPASPSRIIVFIIKNAISNCHKIKKEKKRERNSENRSRSHDWPKKAPKPCEVLQRCEAEWINETTPKRTYKHKVWEKSSNYGLWNVVRVWFFLKNCCNRHSKRIEALRSHRYSCGSSSERVCNAPINSKVQHPPPGNPPGIWTFEDWLVQIPSPRGKKAVQMPHQLVLKYLSTKPMTSSIKHFTRFSERDMP